MRKLYFNTVNNVKKQEITEIFKDLKVEIRFLSNNITEILSPDLEQVIKEKAAQAYKLSRVPIIVEHGGLYIEYLNEYPSALSKPMWDMLGDKICKLIPAGESRKATARSAVCYCDGANYEIFIGETQGTISATGRGTHGFQWDPIFMPDGSAKTYAEMEQTEKLTFSQAMKAYNKLMKELNL
jgi:XTP/dITP diphosphohydrolase